VLFASKPTIQMQIMESPDREHGMTHHVGLMIMLKMAEVHKKLPVEIKILQVIVFVQVRVQVPDFHSRKI
jgi:hypothetical protein